MNTKRLDSLVFFTLDDGTGIIEASMYIYDWEGCRNSNIDVSVGDFVVVTGRLIEGFSYYDMKSSSDVYISLRASSISCLWSFESILAIWETTINFHESLYRRSASSFLPNWVFFPKIGDNQAIDDSDFRINTLVMRLSFVITNLIESFHPYMTEFKNFSLQNHSSQLSVEELSALYGITGAKTVSDVEILAAIDEKLHFRRKLEDIISSSDESSAEEDLLPKKRLRDVSADVRTSLFNKSVREVLRSRKWLVSTIQSKNAVVDANPLPVLLNVEILNEYIAIHFPQIWETGFPNNTLSILEKNHLVRGAVLSLLYSKRLFPVTVALTPNDCQQLMVPSSPGLVMKALKKLLSHLESKSPVSHLEGHPSIPQVDSTPSVSDITTDDANYFFLRPSVSSESRLASVDIRRLYSPSQIVQMLCQKREIEVYEGHFVIVSPSGQYWKDVCTKVVHSFFENDCMFWKD